MIFVEVIQAVELVKTNQNINQYFEISASRHSELYSERFGKYCLPCNPLKYISKNHFHTGAYLLIKTYCHRDAYGKESNNRDKEAKNRLNDYNPI